MAKKGTFALNLKCMLTTIVWVAALSISIATSAFAGVDESQSWFLGSDNCYLSTDTNYGENARKLEVRALGQSSSLIGCVTYPWAAKPYWFANVNNESHAGIDLRVGRYPYPIAYSLFDGAVVEQALDVNVGRSTLVIESAIAGTKYRVFYLHCSEHFVRKDTWVNKGSPICRTGSVGAAAPHLHIEAKRSGTADFNNLRALSGSHCNGGVCYDSSVKSLTVDPVDLIALESGNTLSVADVYIDRCISKFSGYFGTKRGQPFIDSGGYKIQLTNGGPLGFVEAIAIETPASNVSPSVGWYYWNGWSDLPLSACD